MSDQLSFTLPLVPALGRDDFMIAPSNAIAMSMIEATDSWTGAKLVLCGPEGSGKTHLAHVWAQTQGGQIINACDLSKANIPSLATGPTVIEDIPQIAADLNAQTALFHLHNMMQTNASPLLLTGSGTPNLWNLSLPDLQSRIDAAGVATVDAPDDVLLGAVIAKHFADRQVMPHPDVIPYLVLRINRSFAAARDIVATMDQLSLSQRKPLTRSLAALALDKIS